MKREFFDYIEDVDGAITKLQKFTRGMTYEEFVKDDKTVYAVTRAIDSRYRLGLTAKTVSTRLNKLCRKQYRYFPL